MRSDHPMHYRKILPIMSSLITRFSLTKVIEGLLNKVLLNLLNSFPHQTRPTFGCLIHLFVHEVTHSLIYSFMYTISHLANSAVLVMCQEFC